MTKSIEVPVNARVEWVGKPTKEGRKRVYCSAIVNGIKVSHDIFP